MRQKPMTFIVPRHVIEILDKNNAKMKMLKLYEIIHGFWYNGTRCFMKNKTLALETGYSDETAVSHALKKLTDLGLIRTEYENNERFITIAHNPGGVVLRGNGPRSQEQSDDPDTIYINKQTNTGECVVDNFEDQQEQQPKINTAKMVAEAVAEGSFTEFRKLYPKKSQFKKTQEYWQKHRLDHQWEKIRPDLLSKIKNKWGTCDKRYIPNPMTYLEDESWLESEFGGFRESEISHRARQAERQLYIEYSDYLRQNRLSSSSYSFEDFKKARGVSSE
jgi:hypothetical protein